MNELRNAMIKAPFKYTASQTFWSSTTYPKDTDFARLVIDYGYDSYEKFDNKNSINSVRCIRDSK
jgi:hypothetical protein